MSNCPLSTTSTPEAPRLLGRVSDRIRVKKYSIRTETGYLSWIPRFILFQGKRHPARMGKQELEVFLSMPASKRNVSASTQTQALLALLFLYKAVLEHELPA